jgi:hypothetical protein
MLDLLLGMWVAKLASAVGSRDRCFRTRPLSTWHVNLTIHVNIGPFIGEQIGIWIWFAMLCWDA